MTAVAESPLPVLGLLMDLRAATLPVDIPKCLLLLRALEGGFGSDRDALRRLLHHLFSSSPQERRTVDACCDSFFARLIQHSDIPVTQGSIPSDPVAAVPGDPGAQREYERALRLLHSETLETAPESRSTLVQQLVDSTTGPDESALIEAAGLPISPRDYLPISRRQMRQNWRYLRVPVREGPRVEISVQETLAQAARLGLLIAPVLVPRRVSQSQLMLMIDVHGSMTPFHEVARRLIQAAEDGGRFNKVLTAYFHNVPDDKDLMTSPAFVNAIPLSRFLADTSPRRCSIVIISDAGAARGSHNSRRIDAVRHYLRMLNRAGFRVVWLNPMPQSRWEGTSAATLAHYVPMYEITRRGVDRAIAQLKKAIQRRAPVPT